MTLKEQFTNTNWFSRKFIMSIVLEILTTVLLFIGTINQDSWVNMSKWIWIVYGGSNAISKLETKR